MSKLEIKLKYPRGLVPASIAETLCCVLEVFWRPLRVGEEGGDSVR